MQTDLPSFPMARIIHANRGGGQLLKWIGNKQRFAKEIIRFFPENYGVYYEPFLGSGAVLGALSPEKGVASDTFAPLLGIWEALKRSPETLKSWYATRHRRMSCAASQKDGYESIKADYNASPNSADLLFLCRSCYGGVVRFRKRDGYMSTPCGIHTPISPESFARRVDAWAEKIAGTNFIHADYKVSLAAARSGDLVYCDPPYTHSQAILYGAQAFSLRELFNEIGKAKERGVYVALSIDGTKKSGETQCELAIPPALFEREVFIDCGRSMLRRFQMGGETLETECVSDRLLLTY
ncbi:MAG: Dam family site-specific DNA-(adenine-N6)-methyltransferase [Chthoniobacteraceae bacterium]|jgi:DNA adenine methylase